MRAVVATAYGPPDVLALREVETPTPGPDEIRVRVHAAAVTAGDVRIRGLDVPAGFKLMTRLGMGLARPRKPILGMSFSGVVETAGENVERFRLGDAVFGASGAAFGAYAEYVILPADGIVAPVPVGTTHEEAAALPFGALTALHFVGKAGVTEGQRVLVYGASGQVGTALVQVARHVGARVTGVCSARNAELVRSLGAERVVDYTSEPVPPPGERWDVVFEVVGKTTYGMWKSALEPGGTYVMISGGLPAYLRMAWTNLAGRHTVVGGVASDTREGLERVREMVEAGELRPVVDRTWPLAEAAEAHRYAETGRKVGSILLIP